MSTTLKTRLAVFLTVLFIAFMTAAPGYPVKSNEWVVKAGDSLVLKIYNIKRIAIGDPEIIDATSVSKNEVLINGKKEGITTLHVWTSSGWIPYRIKVITKDKITPEELSNIINFIKDFSVKIYQDKIVLNGYAPDKASFEKAEMIAASFYSGVVNLIEIQDSLQQDSGVLQGEGAAGKNDKYSSEFKDIFQKMKGMENINVLDKEGTIVLIDKIIKQFVANEHLDTNIIGQIIYDATVIEELSRFEPALIDALYRCYKNSNLIIRQGNERIIIKTPHNFKKYLGVNAGITELNPLLLPLLEKIEK